MRRWLLLMLGILIASTCFAGDPHQPNCYLECVIGYNTLYCLCGDTGDEQCGITVYVRDEAGSPCEGVQVEVSPMKMYPYNPSEQVYTMCEFETGANIGYTNADGVWEFAPTHIGGSEVGNMAWRCWVGSPWQFYIDGGGNAIKSVDLVITPNTLPRDQAVDLADFGYFAQYYLGGPEPPYVYNPLCDFNSDMEVDLSDFGIFASHYFHGCTGAGIGR